MTAWNRRSSEVVPFVRRAVARRLSVDARALATVRVSLAALVVVDVALRARFLTAFYTDAGVLPRSLLYEQYGTISRLSLHAASGAAWFQLLLFLLTVGAALAMLLGYRTRLATLVTGVLLASLHYRNPLVLNSGDTLLRMLFLWCLFLPIGRRWSVDAVRTSSPANHETPSADTAGNRVLSAASAGILVQVLVVYATNAVLKLRGDDWLSGNATRYVLELDMFTVLFGDTLAQYPALLTVFDRLWLGMLAASFLLVVLTGWARAAFAGLFAGFHAGMLVTMQLGLFPLISIVALVAFLPPVVWDRLPGWRQVPGVRALPVSRYRRGIENALPLVTLSVRPPTAAVRGAYATAVRWKRRLVPPLLVVLLVVLVAWNAATVGLLGVPAAAPVDESPEPRWGMFAPNPASTDFWVVAPATLESGGTVDAFHGGSVTWAEPGDVAGSYPSSRWRKYVSNLRAAPDSSLAGGFADYLCTRDQASDDRFVEVSVFLVEQPVVVDATGPTERVELVTRECSR